MSQAGYPGARGFVSQTRQVQQQQHPQQQQQQGSPMGPIRSLPSPGVSGNPNVNVGSTGSHPSRQSPFPQEGFPPPSSPTSYQTYQIRHSRAMNAQNPSGQHTGECFLRSIILSPQVPHTTAPCTTASQHRHGTDWTPRRALFADSD